jgi:hypothetical protein
MDIFIDSMDDLFKYLSARINLDRSAAHLSEGRLRALADHIRYFLSFEFARGGVKAGRRLPLLALCDGPAIADFICFLIRRQESELSLAGNIGLSTTYVRGVLSSFSRVVEFVCTLARAQGDRELESQLTQQQARLTTFEQHLAHLHVRVAETGELLEQEGRCATDDQVEELKQKLFARALHIQQCSVTPGFALEYLHALMLSFSYGDFPNVRGASIVRVLCPAAADGLEFNAKRARNRENRLFRSGPGGFRLILHRHKNADAHRGSSAATKAIDICIPSTTMAAKLLDFYLSRVRPVLLNGKANEHLFVLNGEAFSPSSWAQRVRSITKNGLGTKGVGPRHLRHLDAVVKASSGLDHNTL